MECASRAKHRMNRVLRKIQYYGNLGNLEQKKRHLWVSMKLPHYLQ